MLHLVRARAVCDAWTLLLGTRSPRASYMNGFVRNRSSGQNAAARSQDLHCACADNFHTSQLSQCKQESTCICISALIMLPDCRNLRDAWLSSKPSYNGRSWPEMHCALGCTCALRHQRLGRRRSQVTNSKSSRHGDCPTSVCFARRGDRVSLTHAGQLWMAMAR